MGAQKRIEYLDIAKGIAIISVVLGHLGIKPIGRFVFTYHLPVFLLISGYFINDKKSICDFSKQRIKSTMVPYVVTCLIIIFIRVLQSGSKSAAVSTFINSLYAAVYGSGNSYTRPFSIPSIGAIWYLPASCIAAILMRICLQLPENWRPVVVGFLFACGYLSSHYLFWFPMSIQAGMCCVLFMYIGWLYKKHRSSIQESISKEINIFLAMLAITIWISFIKQFDEFYLVRNAYGRGIVNIISSICASAIIIKLSLLIDVKLRLIRSALLFAGKHSLLILCCHILELNFVPWGKIIESLFGVSGALYNILLIALKISVLLLATWVLLKFSFVRKIFGYSNQIGMSA